MTTAGHRAYSVDPAPQCPSSVLLGSGAAGSWLLASHPPCSTVTQQDSAGEVLPEESFHYLEFS